MKKFILFVLMLSISSSVSFANMMDLTSMSEVEMDQILMALPENIIAMEIEEATQEDLTKLPPIGKTIVDEKTGQSLDMVSVENGKYLQLREDGKTALGFKWRLYSMTRHELRDTLKAQAKTFAKNTYDAKKRKKGRSWFSRKSGEVMVGYGIVNVVLGWVTMLITSAAATDSVAVTTADAFRMWGTIVGGANGVFWVAIGTHVLLHWGIPAARNEIINVKRKKAQEKLGAALDGMFDETQLGQIHELKSKHFKVFSAAMQSMVTP